VCRFAEEKSFSSLSAGRGGKEKEERRKGPCGELNIQLATIRVELRRAIKR
jgi:hypothetical protein